MLNLAKERPAEGVFLLAEAAVKVLICGAYGAQYLALIRPKSAACNGKQPM